MLRSSKLLGLKLSDDLYALIGPAIKSQKPFDPYQLSRIIKDFKKYEISLLAELDISPSYLVTQKGCYDTAILMEAGDKLFPHSLSIKAPEALRDAQEAAKALAFEMGTAYGFHPFRVLSEHRNLYPCYE